jgi:hypothetical protein
MPVAGTALFRDISARRARVLLRDPASGPVSRFLPLLNRALGEFSVAFPALGFASFG